MESLALENIFNFNILIFIVSGITYFYSTQMLEKSQRSVEDNLDAKVKLVDMEDFYFDLNESLNMDDFLFLGLIF